MVREYSFLKQSQVRREDPEQPKRHLGLMVGQRGRVGVRYGSVTAVYASPSYETLNRVGVAGNGGL